MTQPQSTTDDRRVGPLVQAYGEDGILRDYIAQGVILLNPDGSVPTGGAIPQLPATLGPKTGAESLSVVPATDARFVLATSGGIPAGSPTYVAAGIGYTAYATPTDMICIRGSATKTIAITALAISPQATAQTLGTFYWIKRSAANTGGTLTNPAGIPHDSGDAAATAVVDLYTAAPTLGTAVGNVAVANLNQLATTAQASLFNLYTTNSSGANLSDATMAADLRKPIILRGVAESLCLNLNGAAIPVGFTAVWMIKWIEF